MWFLSLHQRTPLHIATEHHREAVIEKYLVDHGADVNTKDNDGVSEWDYCWLHISTAVYKKSYSQIQVDVQQYSLIKGFPSEINL